MSVVVSVASAREALGWRHALLVLACDRVAPLFAALGLPASIVDSPRAVIDGAQEFWRRDDSLEDLLGKEGARTGPEERRLGTVMLLNTALGSLASAYPEPALQELVAWIGRNYVDESLSADLFTWGQVIRAAVMRGASASLPEVARAAFEQAVAGRIGAIPEAAAKAALQAFEATPPSPFEVRLAERQPELYSLARESVEDTLRNQRTWSALAVLVPQLVDRDGFVAWARAQAEIAGIPPDLVTWRW